MKKMTKAAALALVMVVAMVFGACGQKDAALELLRASRAMEAAKSYHTEMDLSMEVGAYGETFEFGMHMDLAQFTKPPKSESTITMSYALDGEADELAMKMLSDGEYMYIYVEGEWAKASVDSTGMFSLLGNMDVRRLISLYADSIDNLAFAGEEDIAGTRTRRIDGVIKKQSLVDIFNWMTGDMSGGEVDEALAGVEDIPISFWVDKEKHYLIQMECDMTKTLEQVLLAMEAPIEDIQIEKYGFRMNFSDFNRVEDFSIPAAALAAEDMGSNIWF